jgi:hypothetical protein
VEHLEALITAGIMSSGGDGAPDLSALGQKSADREQDDGRLSIREGTGRLAQRRIGAERVVGESHDNRSSDHRLFSASQARV